MLSLDLYWPFWSPGSGLYMFQNIWTVLLDSAEIDSALYSRLGQIFRLEKKQVVVVAKYVKDPKLTIFYSF